MSVRTVACVARAVFKESVRDRVLYNLLGFALLIIGASVLLGEMTAGQDVKIIKDLGLAAMSIFGVFIAVFIGIGLVSKEVERRSIYSLLAKPVRRSEVVVGKFAGLALTLAINLAIMAVLFYLLLGYMSWIETAEVKKAWDAPAADPRMLSAVTLIYVELLLVIALALFFSTFASPLLSAAFTFGLFVAGHFSAMLRDFGSVIDSPWIARLTTALYYVLPDFDVFDVKAAVVHAQPVPLAQIVSATGYGGLYLAALLAASIAIFSARDFK